jgi:hypothetical protein
MKIKSLGMFRFVPDVSKAHLRNVWNYIPDDMAQSASRFESSASRCESLRLHSRFGCDFLH